MRTASAPRSRARWRTREIRVAYGANVEGASSDRGGAGGRDLIRAGAVAAPGRVSLRVEPVGAARLRAAAAAGRLAAPRAGDRAAFEAAFEARLAAIRSHDTRSHEVGRGVAGTPSGIQPRHSDRRRYTQPRRWAIPRVQPAPDRRDAGIGARRRLFFWRWWWSWYWRRALELRPPSYAR